MRRPGKGLHHWWRVLFCVGGMLLVSALLIMPMASFTEDEDTLLLARTIYALGRDESFDTKLKLGTVVMNRVDDPWFPDTLGEVLREQQQFPAGSRTDDESLRAAHALLLGVRRLPREALYYCSTDAGDSWNFSDPVDTSGGYRFYARGTEVRV